MKELIHDVLCDSNDHLYDYVLKWIALMLQKPWIKPEVALVLRGDEGTGKGTFGRALLKIAGNHGLTIANSRQLIGDFNIHLAGKIYLFADEAFWPGEKKGLGNLKALITEEDFSFEGKGVDPVFDKCFLHVVMASNEDWVVPAGINSRRFCILDVSDSKRGDHAFFKVLNHQLRNGGLEGMAHDLMNLDIEGWHPAHNIPRTKALADQIVASLPDVYKWLLSLVDAESLPIMNNCTDWKKAPVRVYSDGKDDLVSAYDDYLQKKKRHFEDPSKTSIYKAGSKAFGFTRVWTQ